MERYLRKSAGNGLERGFGPAAMIDRPLQQQSATRSGLKTRNPCSTRPIGRMSRLTEKVKTEIPDQTRQSDRSSSPAQRSQIQAARRAIKSTRWSRIKGDFRAIVNAAQPGTYTEVDIPFD